MLCVLFICALCEKKNIGDLSWGGFSLTERTYAKLVGRLFSHEGHFFLSQNSQI